MWDQTVAGFTPVTKKISENSLRFVGSWQVFARTWTEQ
jgi:hypothetical protein